MKLWHNMSTEERLTYLSDKHNTTFTRIDHNTCARCEAALNETQRKRYTDILSSDVATMTYDSVPESEINSPSTADTYYWNMLTVKPEARAQAIWCVLESYEP